MNESSVISKITLGTVQLGLPYGIANTGGQPTLADGHRLLQYALDHNIRSVDTARTYGNSEEVIGSFTNAGAFTLISKFKLSDAALRDTSLAIEEARASVKLSCSTLKTTRIPILLFHKDPSQPIASVAPLLPVIFETLKNEGSIGEGGLSVYSPEELKHIQHWEHIRSVQAPMSVFDTRLLQDGLMETLTGNRVRLFIRSIYLQGLITMPEADLPENLSFVQPYLHRLSTIAFRAGRSIKELAVTFVRDSPGVSSIVIGAETIEQLRENIQLFSSPPLPEAIYSELRDCFQNLPAQVITPALWKK